jgi:dihydrofolate synthase/folylpolyglutamate synthase
MSLRKQTGSLAESVPLGKIRSYSEVVEFLDSCTRIEYSEDAFTRMQKIDALFDHPSQSFDTILIGGTNGKSSTANFARKLLKQEGFKVGVAFSSHTLVYNESLLINDDQINNKKFTEILNQVINAVTLEGITPTSFECMTIASHLYFKAEGVEVALVEVGMGGLYDATNICMPKITAITRVAQSHSDMLGDDLDAIMYQMVGIAKKDVLFVSAEQSKLRLQKMKQWVEERQGSWLMPIRKLASLPYIYEQLYGRSASLGERIAQVYVEEVKEQFSPFLRGNLLATKRGQRGRPTLEAKRQAQLNPIKTLKSFWHDNFELLRGRFELLDKEKPTILLDGAHNIDALENVFLGVRLLHYGRMIKGFAMIMGVQKGTDANEVIKLVRYLFKKVPGEIFFVPLENGVACYTPQELSVMAKELNIKAIACNSFEEAFNEAKLVVDDRQGLVAVCGSPSLMTDYWKMKGIKKFH